jgi:hypothetical protein
MGRSSGWPFLRGISPGRGSTAVDDAAAACRLYSRDPRTILLTPLNSISTNSPTGAALATGLEVSFGVSQSGNGPSDPTFRALGCGSTAPANDPIAGMMSAQSPPNHIFWCHFSISCSDRQEFNYHFTNKNRRALVTPCCGGLRTMRGACGPAHRRPLYCLCIDRK